MGRRDTPAAPSPLPIGVTITLDRAVLTLAGTMILASVALTALVSMWWLLLTTFVGLNLLQSSFTGFCPAAAVLRRFGLSNG